MELLRIEDRVFIGCVVAEWARSENTTFLGPLLQFSEFRVQSRSYVIYENTNPCIRSGNMHFNKTFSHFYCMFLWQEPCFNFPEWLKDKKAITNSFILLHKRFLGLVTACRRDTNLLMVKLQAIFVSFVMFILSYIDSSLHRVSGMSLNKRLSDKKMIFLTSSLLTYNCIHKIATTGRSNA